MLIHWSTQLVVDGVAVLAPAWYDVLWSTAVLAIALVPLVGLVWAVTRLVRGGAAPAPSDAARAARRHAGAVSALSWIALAATVVVGTALIAARPTGLAQGLLFGLVPAAAGTSLATVQAVGELTWPRPVGTIRRAPLVRRTVHDVAPVGLRRLALAWAAALVVGLCLAGLVSESGRTIPRTFPEGAAAAGPFPGWFYGAPLLVATVVVVLVTEAALGLIARRPAVSDTATEWDMGLRRRSAHRLLRGAQLVLGLTLAGVLLVAGAAVRNVGSGAQVDGVVLDSPGHVVVGIVLLVLGLAVVVATVAATVLALPPVDPPSAGVPPGTGEQRA